MDPDDELAEDLSPEEADGDDPWHEGGWYFDLPAGAWERQEAKNRMLRENIRANVRRDASLKAQEARRDPFHGKDPLLGLAQHADGPAWGEEMDDAPVSQQADDAWLEPEALDEEEPGSWKADLPGRRPRVLWEEQEPEPEWGAPEDFERRTGPRRPGAIARQHEAPRETAAGWEAVPSRPSDHGQQRRDRNEARPVEEGDAGVADAPPTRSRWDEMFGGPPETSIVEAMRDWSSGAKSEPRPARELTELPPELLQPFDWEDTDAVAAELPSKPAEPDPEEEHPAGRTMSEPEKPADDSPLGFVEQSAFEPGGWESFAAKIMPTVPTREPERKPMRFGRIFGRGGERGDDSSSEWRADPAAISEIRNSGAAKLPDPVPAGDDPAARAGWEPLEDPRPAMEIPEGEESGEHGIEPVMRAAGKPGPGGWGAPPTDEDGSRKYELPRRFTDRDMWDDDWFERPATDGRVPERPAAVHRDDAASSGATAWDGDPGPEPESAGEETAETLAEAYVESRSIVAPEATAQDEALADSREEEGPGRIAMGIPVALEETEAKPPESFAMAEADGEPETSDAESGAEARWTGRSGEPEGEVLAMARDIDGTATEAAARQPESDDPWAAFLIARESDEPLGFRFSSDRDSRLAG